MTAEQQTRRLLDVMAALRHPETGCPWDRVQDFDSLAPYAVEEAYEVADAVARGDHAALPEELGDLLLQVVYHSRLAEEAGLFRYEDVVRRIADKMVRRHPHVFGDVAHDAAGWEDAKEAERRSRSQPATLEGIPSNLPALSRSSKLGARAARAGFDWPCVARTLDKLEEEIGELREELAAADRARLADELGDLLFTAANIARKLGLDAETCLRQANGKFQRRFDAMERAVEQGGRSLRELPLEDMQAAWQQVKRAE